MALFISPWTGCLFPVRFDYRRAGFFKMKNCSTISWPKWFILTLDLIRIWISFRTYVLQFFSACNFMRFKIYDQPTWFWCYVSQLKKHIIVDFPNLAVFKIHSDPFHWLVQWGSLTPFVDRRRQVGRCHSISSMPRPDCRMVGVAQRQMGVNLGPWTILDQEWLGGFHQGLQFLFFLPGKSQSRHGWC